MPKHLPEKFKNPNKDVIDEAEKLRLEREKKQKMKEYDDKIAGLADKTIDFILEYGQEDFRSQMLLSFLDVALEMKDVIKMLDGINVAMACIFEAISFIDTAISFDTVLQEESLQQNYGFFARWKRKRRMKKVIRNNQNRLTVAVDNILGQQKMAQDISDALRESSMRMRMTMDKRAAKRQKAEAKKAAQGKATVSSGTPGKAQALIAELMKARGLDAPEKTEDAPAAGGGKGSASGGVGDISDIL